MTTEEFEPIGYFMGWHLSAREGHATREWTQGYWWTDGSRWIAAKEDKPSLTPAECYEALNRLVEKGYCPEMYYSVDSEGFAAWHFTENPCDRALYYIGRTLTEAVERALLQIAAKEE